MSKTCHQGCEEKKSVSSRYLFEKEKILNSSCSLNIKTSKLPNIDNGKTRKIIQKRKKICKKISYDDCSSKYWLKPGLSLPKMHITEKEDFISQKPLTTTPSADTWKFGLPKQSFESIKAIDTREPFVTNLGGCFSSNKIKSKEFPRNIIGPSMCHSSFAVDNPIIDDNDLKLDEGSGEESAALKNWEKWMRIRRKQNDKFSEKLKRDKCNLVMNAGDCFREMREEKELLTYVRVKKWDKWRGNPKWWTEPLRLPDRGMNDSYYVYETLHERGMVPPMEFVSVPNKVKEEKDVACTEYRGKIIWDKMDYRQKKEKQFSKQLKKMFPHKGNDKNLIIIGEKIEPNEKMEPMVQYDLPDIIITNIDVSQRKMEENDLLNYGVINLIINGVDLYFDGCNRVTGETSTIKREHVWSLMFGASSVGMITKQTIFVENKGTVAVGYKWSKQRQAPYHFTFPARKTLITDPHFFFNKNPGVFLPGQKTEIVFHHHSKNPGFYTETWNLKLNPDIITEGNSAKIRLIAVAVRKNSIIDFFKIDNYLDSCVKETIVRDILWEMVERVRPEVPRDIEYQSLFMEEELFEYQNKAHYYRFDIVQELKSIFQQIGVQPQQEWDLNLFTLEDLIREYVTGTEKREMMCRLMELSRSLLRPGPSNYKFDSKRKMLYNILCSVMEEIEVKAQRIRDIFFEMETTQHKNVDEYIEEEGPHLHPIKSGRYHVSSDFSMENYEEGNIQSAFEDNVFRISMKNMGYYQYVLHLMFFHSLGDAVELAAGVIESCKRFEHHGEVIRPEIRNFLCNDND